MADTDILNIKTLTNHQPFCAGVILVDGKNIVVTLNPDGLPKHMENSAWRIGGVGGGQEPNETIWQCALREACEELNTEVELVHSKITFFHDIDSGEVYTVHVEDELAPLLFERVTSSDPNTPYRQGLPTGPFVYFAVFLAKLSTLADLRPGDDVEALVLLPLDKWEDVEKGITVDELINQGVQMICNPDMDLRRQLWVPPNESFAMIVKLFKENPELLYW